MSKMSPKNIRICPGCPPKGLTLDSTPKFNFMFNADNDTKQITIFDNPKNKVKAKIKSLF